MKNIKLKEIVNIVDGETGSSDPDAKSKGFSIDSRTIKPGEIFIAIKGKNFNGHDFIDDAVNKGAAAVICERSNKVSSGSMERVIWVDDTIKALGQIASGFRGRVARPVVCVTGTNGKTTVKDILTHILSGKYKVLKSKESFNNIIGLSLTLFDLDTSHEVVVLELGTNHPGEIAHLAEIAQPDIAVITNIGDGHLEKLIDREGVFLEKISLLKYLPDDGMVFLNQDDPLLRKVTVRGAHKTFFGREDSADLVISNIMTEGEGYTFSLNGDHYSLPLPGEHNVYNAAAAIAVAGYLDMKYEEIKQRLKDVSLPKMRLERIKIGDILFLNDSYNSNPNSFECAVRVLQETGPAEKKIIVAGDMMELGSKSNELHKLVGESIAGSGMDYFIALGKEAGFIAESAVSCGMDPKTVLYADSHAAAAEILLEIADADTVVLLKGSRASRMEEILKCFTTSCTH